MDQKKPHEEKLEEANGYIAGGVTAGVMGVGGTFLLGVTCPFCVIATPVLIGLGLMKRTRAKKSITTDVESRSSELCCHDTLD